MKSSLHGVLPQISVKRIIPRRLRFAVPAGLALAAVLGLGLPAIAQTESPSSSLFPLAENTSILMLTASPASSTYGAVVTLTATINNSAATGTVKFSIDGVTLGTGDLSSGVATLEATGIPVGVYNVIATYGGDAGDTAATSNAVAVTVAAATTAVGSTSATQQTQFAFTSTVTLNATLATAIQVVTQGLPNRDYKYVSGGSCAAGATYTTGQVCTVEFSFTPSTPGERLGAAVLYDNSATPLPVMTNYLAGTGTGPQGLFQPGVLAATISTSLNTARGLTVDAGGNIFLANQQSDTILKFAAGSTTPTTLATATSNTEATAVDGAGNVFYGVVGGGIYELVGGTGTPVAINSTITQPDDNLAVDGAGNLFTSDETTGAIYELPAGNYANATTLIAGGAGRRFVGMALDQYGNLFAPDFSHNILYELVAGSGTLTQIYSGGVLNEPHAITVDAAENLYLSNYESTTLYRFAAGNYGATPVTLAALGQHSLAIGTDGSIYSVVNGNTLYEYSRTTTSPFVFPNTAVGATSAAQAVTLENDGNVALSIASIAPSSINFTFAGAVLGSTAACGTTLASAGQCGLSSTFTPESAGALGGTGNVTDNTLNAVGTVQTVSLSGTGLLGTKTVTFPQPPNQVAGTSYTLTATSSDGDPVTYATAASPASTATASYTGNVVNYLKAGTLYITATSAATGNAAAASTTTTAITISVAPVTFTAPTTPVSNTSVVETAEVTFTTAGTPSSIIATTQGTTANEFALVSVGTCSTATAYTVGEVCSVTYTFTPETPGDRTGGIVIKNSAGTVLAITVLNGDGTGPLGLFQPGVLAATLSTTLSTPRGLSVDAAGDIYVANYEAGTVLKFPAGSTTPTTLVTSASGNPSGTAVDGVGDVFYPVNGGTSAGIYELVLGTGTPVRINSSITAPDDSLSIDGVGNLYVSDETSGAIYELPVGNYANATTLIAGGAGHRFVSIAIDQYGDLFCPDYNNNILYELVSRATSLTQLYSGTPLADPHGVAVDAAENVYVSNYATNTVYRFAAGNYGATPVTLAAEGEFSLAIGPDGSIYSIVINNPADYTSISANNTTLYKYSRTTNPTLSFPNTALGSASAAMTATLENDGNAALTISSLATSNTNFTVTTPGTPCSTSTALAAAGTCLVGADFTPLTDTTADTANYVVTDNSLYVTTSTQIVPLSGTATYPTPTVTAVSPNTGPTAGGTTVTITGTNFTGVTGVKFGTVNATSFTVVSGTSITAVSPAGAAGTVNIRVSNPSHTSAISTADQFAYYVAPTVTWSPSSGTGYLDVPIGTAVLDAVSNSGGAITYTATNSSNVTTAITSASTLVPGVYTLTANVAANGGYGPGSTTITFTVIYQEVFLANSTASVTSFYENGTVEANEIAGGGIGAALDASGYVWSIKTGGTSVTKFTDTDAASATYTGAGISNASALAIDGNGVVWIANSGSISALTNGGAAVSTTPVAQAGNISSPSSITVDSAGSLWVANTGNNTVTEVIGAAAPVTAPVVTQVINSTPGTKP